MTVSGLPISMLTLFVFDFRHSHCDMSQQSPAPAIPPPLRHAHPVAQARYAGVLGTVGTAVKHAVHFHAVPNDPAAAVGTQRGQGLDGTLEAIE
jgi:hypothetical protein